MEITKQILNDLGGGVGRENLKASSLVYHVYDLHSICLSAVLKIISFKNTLKLLVRFDKKEEDLLEEEGCMQTICK